MKINFVSLFSGIEAASVAMSRIPDAEWNPVFFSEIDPYANALLAYRFPQVPNLGDICKIHADIQKGTITNGRATLPFPDGGIHLLCGGSPCQDVSTAGLRRGMEENSATRSSLAFEYLRLVEELRPRCILWENVAGVLSSRRGLDFRDFLHRLVELGFGVAWRVLDCQYTRSDSFPRAIPQRRRRVFLLGLRTDGRSGADAVRAAEILLERNGVLGNPPTEREEGQALAAPAGYGPIRANRDVAEGFGESGPGYWLGGGQSQTLRARDRPTFPAQVAVYPIDTMNAISRDRNSTNGLGVVLEGDASYQLTASHSHAVAICYDGYNQRAHTGASMTLRSAMTGHDGVQNPGGARNLHEAGRQDRHGGEGASHV